MTEDTNPGQGRCRRGRGRPRAKRMIEAPCIERSFRPLGGICTGEESVSLLIEELEAIRLVDLLDYDQESAAKAIGVSRRTLWRDLHSARKKIADALISGKTIRVISEK